VKRHARKIALALLAAVTLWYFLRFLQDDWRPALEAWQGRWGLVLLAAAMNYCGIAMDSLAWTNAYAAFGMRVRTRAGFAIYLTVFAAQLVPMQLGRLVRPDAVARAGLGTVGRGVKAEAVLFYLDLSALLSLIGAFAVWLGLPYLPRIGFSSEPLGALAATAVFLLLALAALSAGRLAAALVSNTPLALPERFWFHWRTLLVLLLRAGDWLCASTVLYLLVNELPGGITFARAAFFSTVSTLVGSGSGLPGGMGATEGTLGWFLGMASLPAAHLVIAVGLYRFITFWLQVPLGWTALVWVNQRLKHEVPATTPGAPASPPS
jgi:uncharacterized membrane protein YbhN (UPF0104 family)